MREQDRTKREAILAECAKRGIKIEERERCYLLRGPGVDLMAANLADLSANDLLPCGPSKPRRP